MALTARTHHRRPVDPFIYLSSAPSGLAYCLKPQSRGSTPNLSPVRAQENITPLFPLLFEKRGRIHWLQLPVLCRTNPHDPGADSPLRAVSAETTEPTVPSTSPLTAHHPTPRPSAGSGRKVRSQQFGLTLQLQAPRRGLKRQPPLTVPCPARCPGGYPSPDGIGKR